MPDSLVQPRSARFTICRVEGERKWLADLNLGGFKRVRESVTSTAGTYDTWPAEPTPTTTRPWGRAVLVFPSEQGKAWDFENNGMIAAVSNLIGEGRLKVYCVDSYDAASWSNQGIPLEERARQHGRYESWILGEVVPWIYRDCGGAVEVATLGCSMGAFHAANFALKRADLFPLAMCFSGNYHPVSWNGWGERGSEAYFNSPLDYLSNLHGDHLDWLRGRVSLLLVCGQGQWEDTTGALPSTVRLAKLLAGKGIRHELDLWGFDVPHDWPSWRAQLARHMPRFC